ncbi:MAG: RHS repeat-associated core domain-containing protein, partial [Peptococcaceae bacterium]|nr:RHS repeat-associated core domain-containing protein [Peptococcaceae bacterium]
MTYTYDAQNQLLSAVNGTTTYAYTYDTVGNILSGNGHTYTYGDAGWKDLLTAVDGQSITYDA